MPVKMTSFRDRANDVRKKYKDHPAIRACYWNASADELEEAVRAWDAAVAAGCPVDIITDLIAVGHTAGYDSANFDRED